MLQIDRRASGFTLIELLVVTAVIAIVAAIAVPALFRARITANESATIASLRAVIGGQTSFSTVAADGTYATQLSQLHEPCPGSTEGFISPDLANDPSGKSGYTIALNSGSAPAGPPDCNHTTTREGYHLTAVPWSIGWSGQRGFGATNRSVIFAVVDGHAPTEAEMAPGGQAVPLQ